MWKSEQQAVAYCCESSLLWFSTVIANVSECMCLLTGYTEGGVMWVDLWTISIWTVGNSDWGNVFYHRMADCLKRSDHNFLVLIPVTCGNCFDNVVSGHQFYG